MKTFLLTFLGLFLSIFAKGQEVERQVVANAGGVHANSSISMEWTLGELIIETVNNGTVQFMQGFHQPMVSTVGWMDDKPSGNLLRIFPNPTNGAFNFTLDEIRKLNNILVFDSMGRLVMKQQLNQDLMDGQLDISHLAKGTFGILFEFDDSVLNIYRIIVKH